MNERESKPQRNEREDKSHKEWKDNHEHAYHCLNVLRFHDIEYCSFYARRISMPKSFNGKRAYVYCYWCVF
jgi:hypothetical protein